MVLKYDIYKNEILKTIELLCSRGINMNGDTALLLLCLDYNKTNCRISYIFIKYGANIYVKNNKGDICIHNICYTIVKRDTTLSIYNEGNAHCDILVFLINNNADKYINNNDGIKAIDIIMTLEDKKIKYLNNQLLYVKDSNNQVFPFYYVYRHKNLS